MKLGVWHERWIYAVLAFVYLTGVAWMIVRYGVVGNRILEDGWRTAEAWLLRAHGAAAMLSFCAAGTVLVAHVPAGWKLRRSLGSGVGMLATLGVLAITGWLLYYASGESLRDGSSLLHMALGAVGPLILVWHLVDRGRASSRQKEQQRDKPVTRPRVRGERTGGLHVVGRIEKDS